ncbi:hypothetical protein [Actinomadura sp. 6N118]|uniref:hypothetical protein n=1 Tax=Actinomadura sp. 6N118 TaxID=3375151 RepID=UPI003793BDAE
MDRRGELKFDPGALSAAQRNGDACVACHKKWPRPRVRVGRLPDGPGVFACADCATALPRPREHFTEPATNAGGPVTTPALAGATAD